MTKSGTIEVYPDFVVGLSKDLLIKGGKFYAVWDESIGLWSTDEFVVRRIVDADISRRVDELKNSGKIATGRFAGSFRSQVWTEWRTFCSKLPDSKATLDNELTFLNDEVKKSDYRSKRLPYSLAEGNCGSYEELMRTLYSDSEREKLEWCIGACLCGDARRIQKFVVIYGPGGTGKSTILSIIRSLFDGYTCTFDSKALGSASSSFSTEAFRGNPLVAIQDDGDLSRIEDNTKLNSIVSHEEIIINEKYKAGYASRINAFLFMGTNKPVKITDSKSGIIRRLIDVKPTGKKISPERYFELMDQIKFELGGIAARCLEVYRQLGKNYYSGYKPVDMMFQTDVFFNFIEAYSDTFEEQDGVTLQQAYSMYKEYCEDSLVEYRMPKYKFREELKSYFENFEERYINGDKRLRSYYSGFKSLPDAGSIPRNAQTDAKQSTEEPKLSLDKRESILDIALAECKAQYSSASGKPVEKWDECKTSLSDIDTAKEHYVRPPLNHIVIDFDLKNENGEKDAELNLRAAAKFPSTYAEFSKSGSGIHLHYIYNGDVEKLSRIYSEGIEIKTFVGNASLRRRLSLCNAIPIATISSGLPLKGEKMIDFEGIKNEKQIRTMILKNLNKEYHGYTKPSVDFIFKILEDAYKSGIVYDVSDMRPRILAFANNSTNQSKACIELVCKMHFKSDDILKANQDFDEEPIVFYDVEVFPNLFLVNWKYRGPEHKVVRMINPTAQEIERLMRMKLVGFNCRRYDNHILYARYLGYSIEELYILSQRIIKNSRNCLFGDAYNISYTDVYDFCSKKQSLKKWEIELGFHHQELGLPWDKPVPKELWQKVAEYCDNDVLATEAVFEKRQADFVAREILADISGLSMNDTTQQHAAKIIFGDDKSPQTKFVYTDLSETFPGYKFESGKSFYRGEETGEGGYVYSEPGMHVNVALLDIASMHPTSIEVLNLFGPYTKNFSDIKSARLAIKHKDFESAKTMLNGVLEKYLTNPSEAKNLSYALKIVINIVYGLTSASFENKFRDPRNIDNIVAKRGALFMIDLKNAVQEKGFTVAHIKTDSIKIPNATRDIIRFVQVFGKKYGYDFEHEATYDRMCLVNDAVYIARYLSKETCESLYGYIPEKNEEHSCEWTATGAQFQHPYVFKTLFSKAPIEFNDLCETKAVTSAIYLDMNEEDPETHNYIFVGKVGQFCPIIPGGGGGVLLRQSEDKKAEVKEDEEKSVKYYNVGGGKGYRWLESEVVKLNKKESAIDMRYFNSLVDDAVSNISKYGDFEWFTSEEEFDYI